MTDKGPPSGPPSTGPFIRLPRPSGGFVYLRPDDVTSIEYIADGTCRVVTEHGEWAVKEDAEDVARALSATARW